tara:strand:- start:359 stop:1438 length:1080 start_codon:yes stop_codon:yes gene_type:complete
MGNFYTQMKIFHFKDKIDSLPRENKKILPPIHIRIKPTNVCGHNCEYCAYRADNLQLGKDMVIRDFIPKEKMMEIIDDLDDMGVKAVTFSGGGDPFCYPYFLETIQKLSKTNIKFAALTNGSMMKGEVAKLFAKYATWIRVSIDGWDDKSYSEFRKVPLGEFSKVMKNIEEFSEYKKKYNGKCFFGVSIITGRKNAPHLFDMIKSFKSIGVNSVRITSVIISNDGKECYEYHKPIFDLVKSQVAKARELEDENFEIFDGYHAELEPFKKPYDWCPYAQIQPIIGADLNIYPCHDKAYNLDSGLMGTIKDKSFKDYWLNDKDKFFKINPSIDCNHHCAVDSRNKVILDYLDIDKEHLNFV